MSTTNQVSLNAHCTAINAAVNELSTPLAEKPSAQHDLEEDQWPLQLCKPPGTWENKHINLLARPSVWQALL